jgi:hypothetical protein
MQKILPLNYSTPGTELLWKAPFFKYLAQDHKSLIPDLCFLISSNHIPLTKITIRLHNPKYRVNLLLINLNLTYD